MNKKTQTIINAKKIINDRLTQYPDYSLLHSIDAQLDYLIELISGKSSDRSKLKDISIGTHAIHEFENSDPELSKSLKEVQFIVYKMTGRLFN